LLLLLRDSRLEVLCCWASVVSVRVIVACLFLHLAMFFQKLIEHIALTGVERTV